MHHVTSHHAKPHMLGACVMSCNLPPALFWQNDQDFLCATAVTWGWNRYQNKSQHRKLTRRRKFSLHSCRNTNPGPFDHEFGTLSTELSPLPEQRPGSNHLTNPYSGLTQWHTLQLLTYGVVLEAEDVFIDQAVKSLPQLCQANLHILPIQAAPHRLDMDVQCTHYFAAGLKGRKKDHHKMLNNKQRSQVCLVLSLMRVKCHIH